MKADSEDYYADIKVTVEEHHEVEIKAGWSGEWNTNWDTVHIPEEMDPTFKGITTLHQTLLYLRIG